MAWTPRSRSSSGRSTARYFPLLSPIKGSQQCGACFAVATLDLGLNARALIACRSCGCTFPQTDEIDDLFNFSTDVEESGNDLEFDTSELEQIEMLETFRTNLAASSSGAGGAGRINAGRGGALPLPSQEK